MHTRRPNPTRLPLTLLTLLLVLGLLPLSAPAADTPPSDKEKDKDSPQRLLAVAKAVEPALVQVEYTMQFDRGESPGLGDECLAEERPFKIGGLLISPTEVITADTCLHPRFIRAIQVRFGQQVVAASLDWVPRMQRCAVLKLAKPLDGAKPMAFDPQKPRPYFSVQYRQDEGQWQTSVNPLSGEVTSAEDGRRFLSVMTPGLITDRDGVAVGMSWNNELPLDDSWKGSPAGWEKVTAAELATMEADLSKRVEAGLLRVTLHFRSPRKGAGSEFAMMRRGGEDSVTELHSTGLLLDKQRVLILSYLDAKTTARLEKAVIRPGEKKLPAKFTASLRDYGAMVVTLEAPLDGAMTLCCDKPTASRNKLMLAAEIIQRGEDREIHYVRTRVSGFHVGWREQLYPRLGGGEVGEYYPRFGGRYGAMGGPYGQSPQAFHFAFDEQGRCVFVPLARRKPVAQREQYDSGEYPQATPLCYLKPVLDNLQDHADPMNVPLSEEEENRVAWLGVEMQGLNPELARINKVSHLTNDGMSGALVSFVYPNSPADQAGIKVGHILLRLHCDKQPKPLEIMMAESPYGDRAFPWERLDSLPEMYFDRIPAPWPATENAFTRMLTDLGYGTKFTAEIAVDGQVVKKEFTVVKGPIDYNSAPRFKNEALGLTVRDLTYEVRRYCQKKDDDPGVIISKIEQGSKASVSGLKPFEMITHVNDQAVRSVEDFKKLASTTEELRLTVSRMTKGRQVKIAKGPATSRPATRPAGPPEDDE